MHTVKERWKYYAILMFGVGASNIGSWIYLLALNLILFEMTGSPLSIVFLYTLIPLATLCTNSWAGTVIDRKNKRNLMIYLDLSRAIFIMMIPFLPSIWLIYFIAFIIYMANSIFQPTSMTYITKLIPVEQRRQFNSLFNMVTSGAFFIGPAIAGILFNIGTPIFALYTTVITFILSALATLFMPNLERDTLDGANHSTFSSELLKKDWKAVISFSRRNLPVIVIYLLFSGVMMVMATAVDSLEVSFSKEVLQLSDSKYGFLVSIAGAGIVVGSIINTFLTKTFSIFTLMSGGTVLVSFGYMIFAFSTTFPVAALGVFTLAFFISFANTGFLTFYQNHVPVEMMGRISSIYGLIEAILIIMATLILGFLTQLLSLQIVVITGTISMMAVALSLSIYIFSTSSQFKKTVDSAIKSEISQ
ncbi:MFS transporter [Jeotgalibacillus marinus]|uniref:MFS transporter n=1 Tax=Jeotgalibacillus marinus TaxID=86667 RepID=A0ABV3Q0Y5_9BACL